MSEPSTEHGDTTTDTTQTGVPVDGATHACASLLPDTYVHEESCVGSGEDVMYDVEPRVWGASFWAMMHLIAYAYPENADAATRQAVYQTYDALRFALPCTKCRAGYRDVWQQHPLRADVEMASRAALIDWTDRVHTAVNAKLGASPFDLRAYLAKLLGEDVMDSEDEGADDEADGGGGAEGPASGGAQSAAQPPPHRETPTDRSAPNHEQRRQSSSSPHHGTTNAQRAVRRHTFVSTDATRAHAPQTTGPARRTPQPRGARASQHRSAAHGGMSTPLSASSPWIDSGYARSWAATMNHHRGNGPAPQRSARNARHEATTAIGRRGRGVGDLQRTVHAAVSTAFGGGRSARLPYSVFGSGTRAQAPRRAGRSVPRPPGDCPDCGSSQRDLRPSMF